MSGDLATSFSNTTSMGGSNAGLGPLMALSQGISSIASLFSGVSQRSAANEEARNLQLQADLAAEESEFTAQQKEREVKRFAARQAMQFAKSGVSLEGSPLLVLQDTLQLGQQEIDAIRKRGNAIHDLYSSNAQQTKRAGRNALLGSAFDVIGGGLNTFMSGRRLGLFGGSPISQVNNGPPPIPALPTPDYDFIGLR